ncbi:helix-turn-helix domain-containing protein, partial [Bradyrhizobium sp.]|uniref:helix-turn-helix domain-containing protein n=1 Tax=Bradyrhizobium sp. TaxID=376 RepID=UPI00262ACF05
MSRSPVKKRSTKRAFASGSSGGRAARAADRRQAIIEAAFETFIEQGYAATRLDDVAKRAAVAKGTIYL